MKGSEIRSAFLMYFSDRRHTVVSSSSLVPTDDPTLLFANAGMNQFKDIFLGKEERNYKRATSCQKVVRAGGKHNDLENVGRTARHHTFFEMLGNFSFGNYFKEDAIKYAWDFLTKVLSLPEEKLFVTIYKDDDEAFNIWHDVIGLHSSKIIRKGKKDNFWQMGDTGPCGPCSEIFYDQGEGVGCCRPECDPYCDCDRHLEIWNLVFMQYDRDEKGNLNPLPKPSIDTGMGLERIAAVIQGKTSNYDTDLIKPIIDYIAEKSGKKYGENEIDDVSMRVIADHSRSTTFLIADGVMPSNEGRGYVLRRIMRRAMRHGRMLGFEKDFFYDICGFVLDFMKGHYVELSDKKAYVIKTVELEENAFGRTLSSGMKHINEEIFPKVSKNKTIKGSDIFKLYDTYGFPVDLLEDIAKDAGFKLDMKGFEKEMAKQQERAKKAGLGATSSSTSDVLKRLSGTHESEFWGYASLDANAPIEAIVKDDKEVDAISEGEKADLVLTITPFYPESGGQIGDTGYMDVNGNIFQVENTIKIGEMILHKGIVTKGSISKGQMAHAFVDEERRHLIERNHTATHLLHKALQTVIGPHARQAGSLVADDKLRFDFTHSVPLTDEEILSIEDEVNNAIFKCLPVYKRVEDMQDAIDEGATALFGEKYGNIVRVVEISHYSIELCGGCHTDNISSIGIFKIISETSVASGVRRIEALTGKRAFEYLRNIEKINADVASMLKCSTNEVSNRVSDLIITNKEHEKLRKDVEERIAIRATDKLIEDAREINGVKFLSLKLNKMSNDGMRNMVDSIRNRLGSSVVLVAGENDEKLSVICGVSKDLIGRYKAGAIVKEVVKIAGGSGGGKDDMAQAGAKDISKLDDVLENFYTVVSKV